MKKLAVVKMRFDARLPTLPRVGCGEWTRCQVLC